MSQKTTDTSLRTSGRSSRAARGVPQEGQKRAPAGVSAPQLGQLGTPESLCPPNQRRTGLAVRAARARGCGLGGRRRRLIGTPGRAAAGPLEKGTVVRHELEVVAGPDVGRRIPL